MTTTIIYAHPTREGHNGAILKNVETQLKERKEKYEVLDLYKMNFLPVLSKEELIASKEQKKSKDVEEIQKKIKKSDKLIAIYPIWWNSPPAILKGFIDRIFSAGFAFRYVKKGGMSMPEGLLQGRRAIVFTTGGGPKFFFKFFAKSRGSK
jgi:NAD(P)H dehydrogenase (quinone)